MTTVLVTGGEGYLGTVMIPMLLKRGYNVVSYDARIHPNHSPQRLTPGLRYVNQDMGNGPHLMAEVKDADAVIHLGGLVGDAACAVDERHSHGVNVTATKNILGWMAGNRRRIVYASSCSVYGASDTELLTEDSPLNPVSAYAKQRIECENMITATEGIEAVVVRFATLYGVSPRMRFDLAINIFARDAVIKCPSIVTIQGGSHYRPFCHVSDAALAVIRALEQGTPGEAYNVGCDDENYQMREVKGVVEKTLSGTEAYIDDSTPDPRSYHVSFEKIRRELKFIPRRNIAYGLLEVAKFCRDIQHHVQLGLVPPLDSLHWCNYRPQRDITPSCMAHVTEAK